MLSIWKVLWCFKICSLSKVFLYHKCLHTQDDVIKGKHLPRYWPFVQGIHRSPVNSPHKGQWRGALMFSLICAWINGWVNNYEAGDLRRHCAHYDVIVMDATFLWESQNTVRNRFHTISALIKSKSYIFMHFAISKYECLSQYRDGHFKIRFCYHMLNLLRKSGVWHIRRFLVLTLMLKTEYADLLGQYHAPDGMAPAIARVSAGTPLTV